MVETNVVGICNDVFILFLTIDMILIWKTL